MKAIMLKGGDNNNRRNKQSNSKKSNSCSKKTIKLASGNGKPFTEANLHELLNGLIVESNESEENAAVPEDTMYNNDSTSLVNSITAYVINPGNIRKLIYPPTKGNSTP